MGYAVVLDANTLYPASLRDTLLRFAAAGIYDLLWSERILDEMERNLVADGRVDEDGARRLRIAMTTAFDDAIVPDEAISAIEDAMTNDPKDRHVVAAAVASDAQAVVTINLADFPAASTDPFGIDALHPDDFLMVQFGLDPDRAVALVRRSQPSLPPFASVCDGPFGRWGPIGVQIEGNSGRVGTTDLALESQISA